MGVRFSILITWALNSQPFGNPDILVFRASKGKNTRGRVKTKSENEVVDLKSLCK